MRLDGRRDRAGQAGGPGQLEGAGPGVVVGQRDARLALVGGEQAATALGGVVPGAAAGDHPHVVEDAVAEPPNNQAGGSRSGGGLEQLFQLGQVGGDGGDVAVEVLPAGYDNRAAD
jgi:hypothetical protein